MNTLFILLLLCLAYRWAGEAATQVVILVAAGWWALALVLIVQYQRGHKRILAQPCRGHERGGVVDSHPGLGCAGSVTRPGGEWISPGDHTV